MSCTINFTNYSDLSNHVQFSHFGLISSESPATISFLENRKFLNQLLNNHNICGVITNHELAEQIKGKKNDLILIISNDPRQTFYLCHNERALSQNKRLEKSNIHCSVKIHETAFIHDLGVEIARNVVIEPNVTILSGVSIGEGSIIRSGSCIGTEGFEHKKVNGQILSVVHDGFVKIGEYVEIGANNTVARGLMGTDTLIGSETKTDSLVHVAHCAQIGRRCLIPACAMIAGSAEIGDDAWIGPNSSVSSQVKVGNKGFISIGSVVIKDVDPEQHVSGNFALPHYHFLKIINKMKKLIK